MRANVSTVQVVSAALKGDPNISPKERSHILSLLKNGSEVKEKESPQNLPLIVRRSLCAELLGRSVRTIDLLVEQGLLEKKKFKGRSLAAGITRESLLRMLSESSVSTPKADGGDQ